MRRQGYRTGECVRVTLQDGRHFSGLVVGGTKKAVRVQIARNIEIRVPYGKAEIITWHPELDDLLKVCEG